MAENGKKKFNKFLNAKKIKLFGEISLSPYKTIR